MSGDKRDALIKVIDIDPTGQPHKIRVSWSPEMAADIKAWHGINAPDPDPLWNPGLGTRKDGTDG